MDILEEKQEQIVLRKTVEMAINQYFVTLDGQHAEDLYALVLKEVEIGLFKTVLEYANGNQSLAARWLGLARNTLRKKLNEYDME